MIKLTLKHMGLWVTVLRMILPRLTAALKSLADAGGGVCLVPKGTYIISASRDHQVTYPGSSRVFTWSAKGVHSVLRLTGADRIPCCNVRETTGASRICARHGRLYLNHT